MKHVLTRKVWGDCLSDCRFFCFFFPERKDPCSARWIGVRGAPLSMNVLSGFPQKCQCYLQTRGGPLFSEPSPRASHEEQLKMSAEP